MGMEELNEHVATARPASVAAAHASDCANKRRVIRAAESTALRHTWVQM